MYSEVFERYGKMVDKYKDLLLYTERYLYANPETGFKEYKTNIQFDSSHLSGVKNDSMNFIVG